MSGETTLEKENDEDIRNTTDDHDDDDRDEQDDSERRPARGQYDSGPSGPKEKVVLDRPSSAKMIMTVARREIAAYLQSPITYIVISASLVIFGLWFFFYKGGFWDVGRATMQRMFDAVPIGLCGLVPLFTMRSLSDEKRVGTIELLITMPVKDSEVILGKYLGSLAMVCIGLLLLCAYPITMFGVWHLGPLDWNPFWVGMLGLVFTSMAATSIGLMWSSFTESQILSYFATLLTLVGLYALGSVTLVEFLQGWAGDAVSFISLQSRFEPFSRGIIDSRAIVYFLSITVLCLMVSFRSLESRKWT